MKPKYENSEKPTRLDGRAEVIAACLTILIREIHCAGIKTQDALDLLRDAPDQIESALSRGNGSLVVYRLDPIGGRGIVSDSEAKLKRFVMAAERDNAPLFGFCPTSISHLAAYIGAGTASLQKGA